jgi:hypothetical protein
MVSFSPLDGFLIIDDTTLDKPYAKNMDLVYRQWSRKHHRVVNGINSRTLLWTDGNAIIPVDFGIYDIDADGKTKMILFEICFAKQNNGAFSLALFSSIAGTPVWIITSIFAILAHAARPPFSRELTGRDGPRSRARTDAPYHSSLGNSA